MGSLSKYIYKGIMFTVGMNIITKSKANFIGSIPGEKLKIASIIDDGGLILIGISGRPREEWHDLNGKLSEGEMGYWLEIYEMVKYFVIDEGQTKRIKQDLMFKGRNLKDKECKILTTIADDSYIVEFEVNIGGISCDGLGKAGHCLPVSSNVLDNKKEKTENVKKGKLKNEAKTLKAIKALDKIFDEDADFMDFDTDS